MGRKKKEEKKEFLYLNIISILLIFLSALILIVKIQPQETPLKILLSNYLGWSSVFLAILMGTFGTFLNPIFKIKFINRRVITGLILFFGSFLIVDAWIGEKSFMGGMLKNALSSLVGEYGSIVIAIMLIFLGLYLVFSNRFTNTLQLIFNTFANLNFKNPLAGKKSGEEIQDIETFSKEERELFNPENVNTEREMETLGHRSLEKKRENGFELVDSLSEPVSLVKSQRNSSLKSSVSSIGSIDKENNTKYMRSETESKTNSFPLRNAIWEYPPLTLLNDSKQTKADTGNIEERKRIIENALKSFSIQAKVVDVNPGPSVTQYALKADPGTKSSRITNLQSDLALALASPNGQVRIEAPIPGKSLIGIEVPNLSQEIVCLKPMLDSPDYKKFRDNSKLTICLGKDVSGSNVFYALNKMPHVLIAGATGSGKSAMIHSIITTLLFANSPDECKFLLIDPKRVELGHYNDVPHLITPVITEPGKALNALKWIVSEMERRLGVLSSFGTRNIESYNEKSGFQAMHYIAVIIDELADLMMTASNDVEKQIVRIAQLSRATGIHMVLATQRPSTDIITGSIKANVPARIAFNVASQVDSRVIIDTAGADKLLGKGDMLFVPPESSKPKRIQGVWVYETEIGRLVTFLKASDIVPDYEEDLIAATMEPVDKKESAKWEDDLFPRAVEILVEEGKGSSSLLQRRLSIGYARAARILDELEANGVVGPSDGSKPREILIDSANEILG